MNSRLDGRAIAVMTLLCLTWGGQQVWVKLAIADGLPPALQAGLRSLIATVLLLGWIFWREGGSGIWRLVRRDRSLVPGIVMALLFGGEFLLLYAGLTRTTASHAVLFLYTAPFFVALGVHFLVPAERLSWRQAAGLALAFAGVTIAFTDGARATGGVATMTGDLMVTLAATMWAAVTVMVKAMKGLQGIPAAKVLFYQLAGSIPILLGVALLKGEAGAILHAGAVAYASLAYQSVIVAFASYLAWFWLIGLYPAGRLAAFSFLTPLFGMLAGIVILHEPASIFLAFALAAVAAGLYLVNGRSRRREVAVAGGYADG
jgi:drug/metabolite transporter (DMT)-like permease